MRVAVIILAMLAVILGPISGPAMAHADLSPASVTAPTDCDHGPHVDARKPGSAHDHCGDGSGTCMDANGCRHVGCLAGGPVPCVRSDATPPAAPAVPFATADRLDGLDVAPPLDPPRPRA